MSERRLIFYSDGRHTHIYAYDPPLRIEDAVAPIDDVAGSGVDTFVYGFGSGPTMYHNTKVGETWAEHLVEAGPSMSSIKPAWATFLEADVWNTLPFWRAYQNLKSLRERGLDIMELLIDRAHEKGMEFWGSLRSNHPQDPSYTDTADNSTFKIRHPEWCLQTRRGYPFNWVYPDVRAERLALIEEAITQYDLDGFEVDFVFCPSLFELGEVERNAHIVTEFMGIVRRIADDAAGVRGRPVALGARVLPTPESNAATGLDVDAWIREGLVDFVVPVVYGPRQMDVDFPFEWLVDLAKGTDCRVYPALQDKVYSVHTGGIRQDERRVYEHSAAAEHFRAGAAAYLAKGADAIYLPWFDWPVGVEERQILSEIRDPDIIREKRKHYWTTTRDVDEDCEGYAAQLPMTLETGIDASKQTVRLFVADSPGRCDARLRLKLTGSVAADVMTVTVNEDALDWAASRITRHGEGGDIFAWVEFPLEGGTLRTGRNEICVSVDSRPANLVANVVLQSVEMIVDYGGHAANTEFDRISSGRRV